ncbi:putative permease, DMT superfamily [Bacteroidales bacterium Barb6XT]|nr:putative permease, DMT superfamily [Bacteroidales bacterium Barb6XT]
MKQTLLKLHLSIFLAGFTGLFGKLITLNEGLLVCYRMFIAALMLFFIQRVMGKPERISLREFLKIGGAGCLLALHWVFFYGSIKYANISVGVVCFSSVCFFTALFDPLFFGGRFQRREWLFSLLIVSGILLLFQFDMRYRTGILLGGISSAFCALFTLASKKIAVRHRSVTMLLYELTGGFLLMVCLMPLYLHYFPVETIVPSVRDTLLLLVMSFFCTVVLYLLEIDVLKVISAFTVNLSYNLEPVYSIFFAILFFNEARELNFAFYIGLGLVLLSVSLQTYYAFRRNPHP